MEKSFFKNYQVSYFNWQGRKYKMDLKNTYLKLCSNLDFNKEKFVFIALHYQPEETSSPSAGHYVDQSLIVASLSEVLPSDVSIVVKEHSSQFHSNMEGHTGRTKQFYDDLVKIPRVKLVPHYHTSFDYIDNSVAVVTATGTMGWEAVVREKPVLIFGNAWYQYCDNVFRIYSKADLKFAMSKILSGDIKSADYYNYARAIYKNSILAYHYKGYDKKSRIEKTDCVINLVNSIDQFLNY